MSKIDVTFRLVKKKEKKKDQNSHALIEISKAFEMYNGYAYNYDFGHNIFDTQNIHVDNILYLRFYHYVFHDSLLCYIQPCSHILR